MASNDKEQIGRIGEAGLFLVSDRSPRGEWESFPRREPKPAKEQLDPSSRATLGPRGQPRHRQKGGPSGGRLYERPEGRRLLRRHPGG